MTQEEFKVIQEIAVNVDKIPNSKLEENMDKLSQEFEEIKNSIIGMSFYLDKIEELYNRILKEYQNRNGGA
jgi:archaellum component FlaC